MRCEARVVPLRIPPANQADSDPLTVGDFDISMMGQQEVAYLRHAQNMREGTQGHSSLLYRYTHGAYSDKKDGAC